jgi:hypothetical protein
MIFGNWLWPSNLRQVFLRAVDQLGDEGKRRLVGEASLPADRPVAHGGESAFDGICGPQVLPVLGRKIVEREQRLAIFLETLDRLVVLDLVALDGGATPTTGHL